MWEYREEYIEKQDLIKALNFYGKEGWEVFQIEKDIIQKESYGDKWTEINYNVYLKKRVE
jgi:hypothetical protein